MDRPADSFASPVDGLAVIAAAGPLEAVPLRALRDTVLAGDPGCTADPELFTGPSGIEPEDEPEDERAARVDAARDVCAACPVRLPCLAWALRSLPAAGVWAGLLPEEIAALAAAPRNLRYRPAALPGGIAEVA
jgi:WhiB family transcriptional regulator, redox-sensing transcriptional regulator